MDKIKTTDCYVPVDLKDRLPQKNGYYITCVEAEKENKLIHYRTDTGWRNEIDTVTHWLEKKEGVIMLTVEEMEKIVGDAFTAGEDYRIPELSISKSDYIKSLLP